MTLSRRSFVRGLGVAALAGAATTAPFTRRKAWAADSRTRRLVIVGIGGGLRTREALGMAEGATMPNLFGTSRLITDFGSGAPGAPRIAPEYLTMPGVLPLALPAPRARPLYTEGALITNVRYADGPPGHLQGHGCLVSGAYNTIENRADAKLPAP
ncbi:MAG TPA: twin-arginine translocation signal domain-containing protein, partial [Kofleriaceae bacterium]|nr:twin-arginine translocation signal domain-containing protein [Kofleriaceae bacterium]